MSTFIEQLENVSNEQLELFINNFNIEHMTIGTWKSISKRLFQAQNFNRMKKNKIFKEICYPKNSNELKGIIGYFRSIYSNIEEKIKITSSSYPANNNNNLNDLNNLLYIERKNHGFYTDNQQNSWFCFEFKNHRIIPTGYTIRSYHADKGSTHPKKWFIEVSNDSKNFEVIDEQDIGDELNGSYIVKSFPISNEKINLEKGFKFIRIRQDGVNCCGYLQHVKHILHISSIEFYGKIINY